MDNQNAILETKNQVGQLQHQKINWKYQFQQYGVAVVVAGIIFFLFSVYLFYRRGYYNLYIANKIFAGDAAILLGMVLLLGPLSRLFNFFDKYVQFRKELGMVAFFLALAHTLSSYFFLPDKFPRERFFSYGLWPFIFGLAATVLLIFIFIISNQRSMHRIGSKLWWQIQSWGARVTFVLVALHVGVMKWSSWVSWYQKGGGKELVHPEWPGAGLLVAWFMALVIVVRIGEIFGKQAGRVVWYGGVVLLIFIYIFTFIWGRRFIA